MISADPDPFQGAGQLPEQIGVPTFQPGFAGIVMIIVSQTKDPTRRRLLNQLGQSGWEYQRAELLPSEERTGLTGSTTNWRNVLVFRRAVASGEAPLAEPAEQDAHPCAVAREPRIEALQLVRVGQARAGAAPPAPGQGAE